MAAAEQLELLAETLSLPLLALEIAQHHIRPTVRSPLHHVTDAHLTALRGRCAGRGNVTSYRKRSAVHRLLESRRVSRLEGPMHPPRCAARRARDARNEYRGRFAACAAMQQRRVPQIERRGRVPRVVSHYRLGVAFLPYSCYRARGW